MLRFSVLCRGNEVGSFETEEQATTYIDANVNEDMPRDVWTIVDNAPTTKRPYAPPAIRELAPDEIEHAKKRGKK